MDLFESEELKNNLSSWSGVIYKVRFQEQELFRLRYQIIDIGQNLGNTRNLFVRLNPDFKELASSNFNASNLDMLRNVNFENEVIAYVATINYANQNYYPNVKDKIDAILALIDNNLGVE
ncbi:hypothetical protein [Portibacter marinus]|uniref:hypothetical protein n=1 Tax=Portibacter marinus TaxID=2898660 RepID=UPI001F2B7319|nr:hypothetical protein [Portibacter marinus]